MCAYSSCPALDRPENNILLLLTWSPKYIGKLGTLTDWIQSKDGKNLYRSLAKNIQDKSDNLIMSLLALLSFERLLPYSNEPCMPIGSSYLADFHAILIDPDLANLRSNTRYVFEEMTISFRQVLASDNRNKNLVSFISNVLDRDEARPTYLNGGYQYWKRRITCFPDHDAAYDQYIKNMSIVLSKFREECNMDEDHIIVSRAHESSPVS